MAQINYNNIKKAILGLDRPNSNQKEYRDIDQFIRIISNIDDVEFLSSLTVLSKNELYAVIYILNSTNADNINDFIDRYKHSNIDREKFIIRELNKKGY